MHNFLNSTPPRFALPSSMVSGEKAGNTSARAEDIFLTILLPKTYVRTASLQLKKLLL